MNYKQLKKMKWLVTFFILVTVVAAIFYKNIILALAGVLIGLLFLFLVRKTAKVVLIDERVQNIDSQAARITYVILTGVVAFLSLIFTTSGRRMGNDDYELLGVILSYITLLSLALYSVSYRYFANKYGETDDE